MLAPTPPNLDDIIRAFREHTYQVGEHALKRMIQRQIAPFRLEHAIGDDSPEIIANEPEDSRGPCCIVMGFTRTQQPLHARIGYNRQNEFFLITVYDPRTKPETWLPDLRTRR